MENEMMDVLGALESSVARELRMLNQKPTLSPTEIKAATDAMCLLEKIKMYKGETEEYEMSRMSHTRRSPVTGRYVSRDMGYSGHSVHDKMIAKLETCYDDAQSDYEKEEIRKEIDHLRGKSN